MLYPFAGACILSVKNIAPYKMWTEESNKGHLIKLTKTENVRAFSNSLSFLNLLSLAVFKPKPRRSFDGSSVLNAILHCGIPMSVENPMFHLQENSEWVTQLKGLLKHHVTLFDQPQSTKCQRDGHIAQKLPTMIYSKDGYFAILEYMHLSAIIMSQFRTASNTSTYRLRCLKKMRLSWTRDYLEAAHFLVEWRLSPPNLPWVVLKYQFERWNRTTKGSSLFPSVSLYQKLGRL